jgi:thiol-disulfide isomerase/thioredoxin
MATPQMTTVYMFSSPTCAPCKNVKPYVAELQEEYTEFEWKHLDTSDERGATLLLRQKYRVDSIPCMVIVRGEEVFGKHQGSNVAGYLMLLKRARGQTRLPFL